jgi:4-amino-4-deoxy-L-arabinose transferase-like glycosyltransferase
MSRSDRICIGAGVGLVGLLIAGAAADRAFDWFVPVFDAIAHLFYEVPVLAALRRPTQIPLARAHVTIWVLLIAAGLITAPFGSRHGRQAWAIFCVGYAIRAVFWIAGGNLPLVPGDSCHYLEVATSIYRGEGPVKHYVESFFREYKPILLGRGVLDDWATPLYAYVLASAYRITGVVPLESLEATVGVAKGTSFVLNLLALPVLYGFGRRRFGPGIGLAAMAVLAILPVHAMYAAFVLRESLVALMAILAVWTLTESWNARGGAAWLWAALAGGFAGLAILSRDTCLVIVGVCGLYGFFVHRRHHVGPMLAWSLILAAVIAPWAWATFQEYGQPFYTYTQFFQYNFSWTVHHYDRGNTRGAEFYTAANAPTIVRVKFKSLLMIIFYSTMIVGVPTVLGFLRRTLRPAHDSALPGRDTDRLVAWITVAFIAATLARIADITQVAQLGRYYLPLFVIALPTAAAGIRDWMRSWSCPPGFRVTLAATFVALVWADPTWAYDASWFAKPYQLHWPSLRAAGDWIKAHPDQVPPKARIMTWFPWELRVASDRTTILFPRSLEGGNYELKRLQETIRQYQVTHVLWGSFEPSPNGDPESLGPYLEQLRLSVGLSNDREIYRSPRRNAFPVRLYRLTEGTP